MFRIYLLIWDLLGTHLQSKWIIPYSKPKSRPIWKKTHHLSRLCIHHNWWSWPEDRVPVETCGHQGAGLQGVPYLYATMRQHQWTPLGRCTQVEKLLHRALGRDDDVEECERQADCWKCALPSLGQVQQADKVYNAGDSLSSHCLDEHSNSRDIRKWQQVPIQHNKHISSVTSPPSQVSLHNRYEVPEVEPSSDEDDASSRLQG